MFVNWRSPPPPLRVTPPAPDTTPVNLTVTPLLRLKVRLPGSVTAAVKLTDLVNNAVSPACGTAPFCQFEAVPQTCVPVPPIHVHVAAGRVAPAAAARNNTIAFLLVMPIPPVSSACPLYHNPPFCQWHAFVSQGHENYAIIMP